MASFIKIKRSTGTIAPATLQYGELAYTAGVGTHGNGGGRLFVGDNAPNAVAVGGRYYTDLLSIAPGSVSGQSNPTTPANGFVAILDQNRKVDQWNVDNLTLDGNTFSSTNTDGDINIDPNGTGEIVVPDDTFLTFGTSKDTKIKYNELTNDRLEVTGADWNFANGVAISVSDTTESTSTSTGAFVVVGGVGIGARLNVAGNVDFDGDLNIDGGDVTSNTSLLNLFNTTVTRANVLGSGTNIVLGATTGVTTIRNSILDLDGDLNIDGGDLTSNASTFNLLNKNSTTINAFYGATSVGIGSTSSTSTVTIRSTQESTSSSTGALVVSGGVGIDGNLNVSGSFNIEGGITGTISTATRALTVDTTTAPSGTFYPGLFVSPTGTASTTVYVDSGISYVSNTDTLALTGDIAINGGDATTSSTIFNLINANATNINFGGAATAIVIGATSGIATLRNPTLVGTQATQNLYNTVATNINFGGAATALIMSATTGVTTVRNKLNVGGNLQIDGNNIQSSTGSNVVTLSSNNATFANDITVQGNTNLGNSATDQVTIVGNVYHTGVSTNVGGIFVDAVGISSNVIQTRPGTGDKLFIDPYPDGLSNEGTVIIKGDLQVDGTTITVNSTTVTSNNPIFVIGDNATNRTVMTTVATGNQLTIDSVAAINVNDVVTGNNIPSNTVITNIDAGTKVITLSNDITGTIDATSQITITQGIDTNDDRGIAFKYVSSGTGIDATVKTGFFGYVDNTSRWTYVPDAGIAGNVVTGTKGFLDIKGIYYQSGDYSTNGVTYFDSSGLLKSTVAPGAGISTSNYILTTDASGVPTWTDTIDGGTF